MLLEGSSKRKSSGVRKVAVFVLYCTSLYPSSVVRQILSDCISHSEVTWWHSARKISSCDLAGLQCRLDSAGGQFSTGRIEGLARNVGTLRGMRYWCARGIRRQQVAEMNRAFVWEGLWHRTAIHFVPYSRVGYQLQLQPSIDYDILV